MRTFVIYYFRELSDECHSCELEIKGENILNALENFYKLNIVLKRVYKIDEL